MTAAEPLPVPLRAPRDYLLRADLPDDPDQIFMKLTGSIQQTALGRPQEPDLTDPQHHRCFLLFCPADAGNLTAGNIGIEPTTTAVSQHAVGHLDASVRPSGDGAACPELGVVRVCHDHENPLDLSVRDHGNRSPPGSATHRRNCTPGSDPTGQAIDC